MHRLWGLSLPRVCRGCGRYTQAPLDCCPDCEAVLPTCGPCCARCALPLAQPSPMCNACLLATPAFDQVVAGFAAEGLIKTWLSRFKAQGDLVSGHLLTQLLARRWQCRPPSPVTCLIPMPMPWGRWLVQGFDHSRLLCQGLAKALGNVPWVPALRCDRVWMPRQSQQPFVVRNSWSDSPFVVRHLPSGTRSVALIDDVLTTGTTAHHAALALKAQGVREVSVWVVAREVTGAVVG